MAEKTLFARKATGLVREVGFITAVILAIANVVGLGWQKRVFQSIAAESVLPSQMFLGIHPMIMAFFIVGILMLLSIYTFMVLSAAMPRSGGGYVFMSRILSPGFSFVATCLEFLSVAVSYGLIAVATFEATLIFGGLAGIDTSALANPWFMSIFGIVIIAIFSAIACLGTRQTGYLLHIIFWVPAAVLVLVYLVFIMATPTAMENGVQLFTGHSASEYTQAALAQGLTPGSYWSAVFTACFYAYWAYIGYAAASFVAGEVKEASRSLPRAILTSGIVIMLIYMTISFFLARAGSMAGRDPSGFSLLDAVGFLAYGGGSYADAGLPSIGAWMPTFAGISAFGTFGMAGGRLFGWLLLAFGALWVANDIPPFILTCSRMMFAMGFDRILPEWVADVNEKWHSPVNAIIVTSVAALLGVVAEAELFSPSGLNLAIIHHPFGQEWISSGGAVVATDLWDALFFSGVALSCALFPSRMPEVFERAPWRQSKTVVQVLGWLAFVANVLLSLLLVFHENAYGWGPIALSTPLGTLGGNFASINFWFTIVLILVSLGVYYWGRSRARRVGADLTTIFAEIPPE
jgi:APA family basic amino acid/polyamine antiporter